ncbi:MAG: tRNA-dihydrouridine synthase family protein [Candidatus Heimdallarchaeaceae archaeon]
MKLPDKALVLAPLVRYTRYPFRVLSADYGADITITEMVNAKGLLMHYNKKFSLNTHQLIYTDELEPHCGIQLFGNNPHEFGLVAKKIEERTEFKFINLNLGCPKRKITQANQGSALLKNLSLVETIIEKLVKNTSLPITIKTRIGWDTNTLPKLLKIAEEHAMDWIIVHCRYAIENYKTKAHREIINQIAETSEIPIIANGDVYSHEDIDDYFARGAQGVAIGRWAKGNPFVFDLKRKDVENISFQERLLVFERFLELSQRMFANLQVSYNTAPFIKIFAMNISKGLPSSSSIRNSILRSKSVSEIKEVLNMHIERI